MDTELKEMLEQMDNRNRRLEEKLEQMESGIVSYFTHINKKLDSIQLDLTVLEHKTDKRMDKVEDGINTITEILQQNELIPH